jgi:type II secretory pathway pseudopilin PulG
MTRAPSGFSVVELLVALAITTTCAAAILSLIVAGQSIARRQPELSDQQQRARVAVQTLAGELARAGAGLDRGERAGPLARYFAPIAPSADGGVTVWYVSDAGAQAQLATTLDPDTTLAAIASSTCPSSEPTCAFSANSTVILFDDAGCRDAARVDDVSAGFLTLRSATRSCGYAAGSWIAQGEVRTYRVDPATRQLIRRDEATGSSLPVLDNVAGMTVEYLESGRRLRVWLRLASALPQVPELLVSLDTSPPNLRAAW